MQTQSIIESDIASKIMNSDKIDDIERNNFLNLLSYFTQQEIEELKMII